MDFIDILQWVNITLIMMWVYQHTKMHRVEREGKKNLEEATDQWAEARAMWKAKWEEEHQEKNIIQMNPNPIPEIEPNVDFITRELPGQTDSPRIQPS